MATTTISTSTPALLRIFYTVALPTTVLAGIFFLAGKYVEVQPQNHPSISVQGETKVAAKPDLATVTLGVQTGRQETSQEAMDMLEQNMKKILDAVAASGIEQKDIQTSGFTLYPAYDWKDGEQIPRGYEASQSVAIKVRDPSKVADVISAATQAGANNVSGIEFRIDDLAAVRDQARKESIAKAKEQAEKLAAELGMHVGELMSYGEDVSPYVETSYGKGGGYGGGGDMAQSAVPSGEQEITVRVYLTYELK